MPLTIGSRLGSYEILSALGTGGMGAVYLARDTKLARNVAIKVLQGEDGKGADSARRLLREARAAARLDHPNICAIYEVGEADGRAFIVMQLLEGKTLEARLRQGPIDVTEAVSLGAEIADALGEAHARGIVHRDIKPANIMIAQRGQAKVMDFGIAAPTPDRASPAETTVTTVVESPLVGSLPYMSPEQVRGDSIDGRSDVFSLGGVIYEAVTGHRPFAGTSATETISAILTREPKPIAETRAGLPDELERILQKALAKNRDERYQSAADLAVDLRRLLRAPDRAGTALARRRATWIRLSAIAGATVVVAAAAGLVVYGLSGRDAPIRSVAVMPLANAAADPEMDYLADGITDQIIDRLSQLPDLKVMAHSAVFHYKGKDQGARTVGRELGVEAVLIGQLTKRSNDIAIRLELVSVDDEHHIWGDQYIRPLSELVALQSEIPVDISTKLRLRLEGASAARLARIDTKSSEAYQLYLKGRSAWEKWTMDGARQAIDFFERAIAIDPNYALAYSGIADTFMIGSGPGSVTSDEADRRAREAAKKALSLDSDLAEAHSALAGVLTHADWNFAEAEKEYQRAIALNTSCAECYHEYSHLLLFLGRFDESLVQSRKFLELDPVSETPIGHLGYHYLRARRFADATAQYEEDRRLYPDANTLSELGDAYYFNGRYREAVDEYIKLHRSNGASATEVAALTAAFSHSGITGYLRTRIEQWTSAPQTDRIRFAIARYSARLGNKDRTFELLERLFAEHSSVLVTLKEDPSFDPVHSDPRFSDLLRRVGLPQ